MELDPRMAAEVTKRFQGTPAQKRLEVILGDVMKTELPYFDVCISNTPYQVCFHKHKKKRLRLRLVGPDWSLITSHLDLFPSYIQAAGD